MKYAFICLLFAGGLLWQCQQHLVKSAASTAHNPALQGDTILIDLAAALRRCAAPVLVNISTDHYFRQAKQYEAVPLTEILQKNGILQLDTADYIVDFYCSDGYAPQMTLAKVLRQTAYVAVRDVTAPRGKNWPDAVAGAFAPYYLVWENMPYADETFMWPYGLTRLLIYPKKYRHAIQPLETAAFKAQFEVFNTYCLKCHAINGIGGTMGPELNYPRNITEYWTDENLRAFIKAPQSFRHNCKMPALAALSSADLDAVLGYLHTMKGYKKQ